MHLTDEQRAQLASVRDNPYRLTGLEDWFRLQGLLRWEDGGYRLTEAGQRALGDS